ncbi:unnamed protein product [Ilex paraguariensis]|uniref:Uncharacterized protein n=1 Tax=Ilex paraguariensis TaxID=185542 RepID=A0ABC8RC23_9AQUA
MPVLDLRTSEIESKFLHRYYLVVYNTGHHSLFIQCTEEVKRLKWAIGSVPVTLALAGLFLAFIEVLLLYATLAGVFVHICHAPFADH